MSQPRSSLWAMLCAVPAIIAGVAIAVIHGISWSSYIPNALGLVLGCASVYLACRTARARLAVWLPSLAALAIVATLLGAGIDGVHRWLALGPLLLNASSAFAPWLLLGLDASTPRSRTVAQLAVLIAQLAHVMQPDAAQATALATAVIPFALRPARRKSGIPLALAVVALAIVAWSRPDPLLPVDQVERILVLAATHGAPALIAVALAGLALLLPFVVPARRPDHLDLAIILYLLASFAVTFIGNFPVPVFGAGAGPVLGWYALLAVRATRDGAPP